METFVALVGIGVLMFAPWFGLFLIAELLTFMALGVSILSLFLGIVWFYLWFHFTGKDKDFEYSSSDLPLLR